MKQKKELDYVKIYAEKMKEDNRLFKQQKEFIESQLQISSSIFSKMFGKKNFKANARKYLKKMGKI